MIYAFGKRASGVMTRRALVSSFDFLENIGGIVPPQCGGKPAVT
nr:hypothetical protein [Armatimonas sp.]